MNLTSLISVALRISLAAGGLLAALWAVIDVVVLKIRRGSFELAMETTWITRRETTVCAATGLFGWAAAIAVCQRETTWESSLVLTLAASLMFSATYWFITQGDRSRSLLLILVIILPMLSGISQPDHDAHRRVGLGRHA